MDVMKHIPIIRSIVKSIYRRSSVAAGAGSRSFPGSATYWETRYASGGNSGAGSYTKFAEFKAKVINDFVTTHDVRTVIEFGCGDGNQLLLARYPSYIGFDVSATAISQCRGLFRADLHKSFRLMSEYRGDSADLTLSLDVIYHLVEDGVYGSYMRRLFGASKRYTIIYASDHDEKRNDGVMHIRHRKFTKWVQLNLPAWKLVGHIPNKYPYRGDSEKGSFADFFVYESAAS